MGRPREFNLDNAVDTAVDLFWRNGYDKTSLTDLTQALKITPPSFYFAFGSKEALFKKVVERYMAGQNEFLSEALRQPTSRGFVTRLLEGIADLYSDPAHPGCLCGNSMSPCTEQNDPVQKELAKWRAAFSKTLRQRFKQAKLDKDLPSDADPDGLTQYVLIMGYGMALAAQSGASRKQLRLAVATALKTWPS
jgi:AcrR family transcriptional regulator